MLYLLTNSNIEVNFTTTPGIYACHSEHNFYRALSKWHLPWRNSQGYETPFIFRQISGIHDIIIQQTRYVSQQTNPPVPMLHYTDIVEEVDLNQGRNNI